MRGRFFQAIFCFVVLSAISIEGRAHAAEPFRVTYSNPVSLTSLPALSNAPNGSRINPSYKTVADIDGDGFEDVFYTSMAGSSQSQVPEIRVPVKILISNGRGGFQERTQEYFDGPIPVTDFNRQIIKADFNGDGRPDFLLANTGREGPGPHGGWPCENNTLILSQPNGKLKDVTSTHLPTAIAFNHGVTVGDFDGDGDIDVFSAHIGSSCAVENYGRLLFNDGTGRFHVAADFGPQSQGYVGLNGRLAPEMQYTYWSIALDLNDDGVDDMLTNGWHPQLGRNVYRIFMNDGSGHFAKQPDNLAPNLLIPTSDAATDDMGLADIDNDGRQDVVANVTNSDLQQIQILRNNGDGTLTDRTAAVLGTQPADSGISHPFTHIGDFDGDGEVDLARVSFGPDFQPQSDVRVLYVNRGNGTFYYPRPSSLQVRPDPVLIDANGDNIDDWLYVAWNGSGFGWFLQRGNAQITPNLVSSVLPTARATTVGNVVTAFGAVVNASNTPAQKCMLRPPMDSRAGFSFQATDANLNLTGQPNKAVDVPANGTQYYVFAMKPLSPMSSNLKLFFDCANKEPAKAVTGLNTFVLTGTGQPTSDIVAIASTPSNDGIVNVPGRSGTGVFSAAAVNIGSAATVTVKATDTAFGGTDPNLPLNLFVCRTNPSTGACQTALVPEFTQPFARDEVLTFAVFVAGRGQNVAFDPATRRIHLLFLGGTTPVGATSVAVRTN